MADSSNDQTLLIMGASGDLTARLLLPGLGALLATGSVQRLHLIGSAVDDWDDDRWRARIAESFAQADASGQETDAAIKGARYLRSDVTDQDDLRALLDACRGQVILYFALPPTVTEKVIHVLTDIGVPAGTRLVTEKPFGSDAASAAALNDLLTQLVPEDHVHRIDHFVAMPSVLSILGVRFANRMVEPLLNSQHVESVDVIFDESLALEGRAGYYDGAGAMVDMIQSHLLEVMSLFAMEPVPTLAAEDVRDAKAQILRATRIWHDDPATYSRRARYTAGEVDGRMVPSYVDEEGIDGSRDTETFAELVLAVDTWRWAGVPFRLRSGKALGSPRTEVTVTFKPPQRVPTGMTGDGSTGYGKPDRLHIGIALDTNLLGLDLNITGKGDPSHIDPVSLVGDFGAGRLPPYGEVLRGVLQGDPPLSVRGDMAVQCWRIIEPVQKAWRENRVPLREYEAGGTGPGGWPHTGLPA
ncbi:glucose-6-phosphate dehydrogenase [Promicromonospora umidemergens]|uniref:Glucose-6-phosphate dehydrogenase n=1 Tax=Promicromonospora umidemergens TaxID=629679 RepID=A0ABP8XAZ1_9MICO|nr:glucose-6-phosphate dehydrogenase [Promicromonospora umidemergens]